MGRKIDILYNIIDFCHPEIATRKTLAKLEFSRIKYEKVASFDVKINLVFVWHDRQLNMFSKSFLSPMLNVIHGESILYLSIS